MSKWESGSRPHCWQPRGPLEALSFWRTTSILAWEFSRRFISKSGRGRHPRLQCATLESAGSEEEARRHGVHRSAFYNRGPGLIEF